jgi:ribosomal-protein-alanine N-acetyltransferase
MLSDRLRYRPVTLANLDAFHSLVQDDHVRRYLLDGNRFPPEWSEERIRDSEALFERRGVGLWLASDITTNELVGFCGFMEMPAIHPEPQLVYAMFERYSGKGYATEMARASIDHAGNQPGFADVMVSVDAVNVASLHVLEKLGFEAIATQPGSFGDMLILRLALDPAI